MRSFTCLLAYLAFYTVAARPDMVIDENPGGDFNFQHNSLSRRIDCGSKGGQTIRFHSFPPTHPTQLQLTPNSALQA